MKQSDALYILLGSYQRLLSWDQHPPCIYIYVFFRWVSSYILWFYVSAITYPCPELSYGIGKLLLKSWVSMWIHFFHLRPVLASMYCCLHLSACVCLSVSPSVHHKVCLCNNAWRVKARITKFGPEVQNNLVKISVVLRGGQPSPSRSNLTSNLYPILSLKLVCMITHHPFKLETPNLDQRCKTACQRS